MVPVPYHAYDLAPSLESRLVDGVEFENSLVTWQLSSQTRETPLLPRDQL